MSYTNYNVLAANSTSNLAAAVTAAIADDWQPHGPPFVADSNIDGTFCQAVVKGTEPGSIEESQAAITLLQTQMGEVDTWADALATKLNADATAQNALADFPLTLDTDYAALTLSS